MHILIAPNAFKNSLDAVSVAEAVGKGLQQSRLDCSTEYFPVGDGGDGTAALIIQKQKGIIIEAGVHDALGRKIKASYGLIDDNTTAIIEMANASGLRLLKQEELDPLHATTFGTGELIKDALDRKVRKIILCIGGSATVDGGTGILQALGIQFMNDKKETLNQLPITLTHLAFINTDNFDRRILNCELVILCDVENKLLGPDGAANVFGPQKGASKMAVKQLEAALTRLRDIILVETGIDIGTINHSGAAGGVAAGLSAYCKAKPVNGIEYFLQLDDFDKALQKANLVITGEGKIDEQTLHGKGPYGVAVKAKEKQIPVIGIAGDVPLERNEMLQQYFDILISVNNKCQDLTTALANTESNLIRTGKMIGDMLALKALNNLT